MYLLHSNSLLSPQASITLRYAVMLNEEFIIRHASILHTRSTLKNRNKLHNCQWHIFWLRKTKKHFKFPKLCFAGLAISFARTRGIWFSQNSTALWLQSKTSGSHKGIPEKSVWQKRDKPLSETNNISFKHGATAIMIAIKAIETWNE